MDNESDSMKTRKMLELCVFVAVFHGIAVTKKEVFA
jgi:hypothetical protein